MAKHRTVIEALGMQQSNRALEAGSESAGDAQKVSELHEAVCKGDVDTIATLLRDGVNADVPDSSGMTALQAAAFAGGIQVVQLLVLVGQAGLDAVIRSYPPLTAAATKGYTEIVRFLLAAKADVHANSDAIELAAERGHTRVVELLLASNADVNARCDGRGRSLQEGRRPITIAATNNHLGTVKVLLAAKADPDVTDENGITPASYALERNEPILYALLDPDGARVKGAALREDFKAASIVHVLSTRFKVPKELEQPYWKRQPIDPRLSARELKKVVEADELILTGGEFVDEARSTFSGFMKVFDPNADNAFLMDGDESSANAIWLLNWREVGLENARRTGGAVLQLLVQPGLSKMQIAEESMARDAGVRVVRVDCTRLKSDSHLRADEAMGLAEVRALKEEARQVKAGELTLTVPLTRHELKRMAETSAGRTSAVDESSSKDGPQLPSQGFEYVGSFDLQTNKWGHSTTWGHSTSTSISKEEVLKILQEIDRHDPQDPAADVHDTSEAEAATSEAALKTVHDLRLALKPISSVTISPIVLALEKAKKMLRTQVAPMDLVPHAANLATKLEHPWVGVRQFAAEALGSLPPDDLAPHVTALVPRLDDPGYEVRLAVVRAFGCLVLDDLKQHTDSICARLEDSAWQVRQAALQTLEKLPPVAFANHASAVAVKLVDKNATVRSAAAQALRDTISPARLIDLLPASYATVEAFRHRDNAARYAAAEHAIERNDWVIVRELSALFAEGPLKETLVQRIDRHAIDEWHCIVEAAETIVVVLSSRYDNPSSKDDEHTGLTPLAVSDLVKEHIEARSGGRIKVFNPNRDNVAIQGGDQAKANGVWLRMWRQALVRSKETGGCMLRLDLTEAGLSAMQEAETDMALDKGVPTVVVRFSATSTPVEITAQLTELLSKATDLSKVADLTSKAAEESHLRLGMTIEAMEEFTTHTLAFPESYRRDEAELGFVTEAFGPVNYDTKDEEKRNLTGYDLIAAIRAWLKAGNNEHLSVCEVLAAEGHPGVGTARIFYSHMQSLCAVKCEGTFYNIVVGVECFEHALPPKHELFVWMDCFVLRQCHNDFNLKAIRTVIRDIGCTMVEIDTALAYLKRSFCIFEVFATIESGAKLLVAANEKLSGEAKMEAALSRQPVQSAAACSLYADDKRKIDEFISSTLGFDALDTRISAAFIEGAKARKAYFRGLS